MPRTGAAMAFVRERVLVPIDFSERSTTAIEAAFELVGRPANLYLVHVLTSANPGVPDVRWDRLDVDKRHFHATRLLERLVAGKAWADARLFVLTGDPAGEIVRQAERIGADLIVIPPRANPGIAGLLLGSVSRDVVRDASCSVLVLK